MKIIHLKNSLFAIIAILLLFALESYGQAFTYPIYYTGRYIPNGSSEMLTHHYFEINVVTDTPGQAPSIMFLLKPDANADVMTDCIWFATGVSEYSERADEYMTDGLFLFSDEFPHQYLAIGYSKEFNEYFVAFGYTDKEYETVEQDIIMIPKESYAAIKKLVREQIRNLDIKKMD